MATFVDDAQSLFRGTGILFIGRISARGLGLLGQILLVRSLSPSNFGILALGYTIVLALARLYSMGISQGVTRFISSKEISDRKREETISAATTFILTLSGISGIFLFLSSNFLANLMNTPRLRTTLVLFLPVLLFFPFARLFIGILRAEERSLAAVLSQDLFPKVVAVSAFVVVSAALSSYLGAVAYWNGTALTMFLFAGYAMIRHVRNDSVRFTDFRWKAFRDLWAFSWPLVFSTSFAMLLSYADVIMIGYFLSESRVGIYRAIQPLRQVTLFVLTSVVFLYLPIASKYHDRTDHGRLNDLYSVATKWVTLGTFPFVAVFALFSPDIIRAFFTASYVPAAPALSVLIVGMFIRAIAGPTGETVKAINKTRVEFYASGAGLVVNVLANIVLIPQLNIVGAAIGTTIGFVVFNLVELSAIYRVTGGHPFTPNTFKPLVPTVVFSLVLWSQLQDSRLGLFSLVGIGILITAFEIVSIPLTKSVDDIDLELAEPYLPLRVKQLLQSVR